MQEYNKSIRVSNYVDPFYMKIPLEKKIQIRNQ